MYLTVLLSLSMTCWWRKDYQRAHWRGGFYRPWQRVCRACWSRRNRASVCFASELDCRSCSTPVPRALSTKQRQNTQQTVIIVLNNTKTILFLQIQERKQSIHGGLKAWPLAIGSRKCARDIPQGSVAIYLRRGGDFNDFTANLLKSLTAKKNENRSSFDEVTGKSIVAHFLTQFPMGQTFCVTPHVKTVVNANALYKVAEQNVFIENYTYQISTTRK